MPNYRTIHAKFMGIKGGFANAPLKVTHLSGNHVDGVEFIPDSQTFYTNEFGEVSFDLWTNEEGERASVYGFLLPGGESFEAIIPVGNTTLELSDLRIV